MSDDPYSFDMPIRIPRHIAGWIIIGVSAGILLCVIVAIARRQLLT